MTVNQPTYTNTVATVASRSASLRISIERFSSCRVFTQSRAASGARPAPGHQREQAQEVAHPGDDQRQEDRSADRAERRPEGREPVDGRLRRQGEPPEDA